MSEHHQGALYYKSERFYDNVGNPQFHSDMDWFIRQNAKTHYYELYYGEDEDLVGTYTDIIDAIKQGRKYT